MSDERPSDVLGALPRRRPHRRSEKRPTPAPVGEHADGPPALAAKRSGAGATTAKPASAAEPSAAGATTAKPGSGSRPRGAQPAKTSTRQAPATRAASLTPDAPRRRAAPLRQPAQPAGTPPAPAGRAGSRERSTGRDIVTIAAQAAAELAEIGLSVSARALRNAVGRLPRP